MEGKSGQNFKVTSVILAVVFLLIGYLFVSFPQENAFAEDDITVAIVGEGYGTWGHATGMREKALIGLGLDPSENDGDVVIVADGSRPEELEDEYSVFWHDEGYESWQECVIDMSFDVASMSVSGISLSDDIEQTELLGSEGIGFVKGSHGSGEPFYTLGFATSPTKEGATSQNPSTIDFVVSGVGSPSAATSTTAGYLARILREKTGWNYYDARAALRQTASGYATGWVAEDENGYGVGYGVVDIDDALALNLGDLELFPPILHVVDYCAITRKLDLQWAHYAQSAFHETVIALFEEEPPLSASPNDADEIIYSGTDTSCTYTYGGTGESFWIAVFTKDSSGNYSRLEEYAVVEVEVPSLPVAQVDISVALQGSGRPDPEGWEIPITVNFFLPGADVLNDTPIHGFELTTYKEGDYAICQAPDVTYGTYDITVQSDIEDGQHTLMNVKHGVWIYSSNVSVDMGMLLEGDCDDSGGIDGSDFDIFGAAWDTCYGLPNWDPRADFDRSGCIDGSDFNLFGANWDKSSPIEISLLEAQVDISVALEGTNRPPGGWEIPITIGFFIPGADVLNDCPIKQYDLTTTKSGDYAICQATGVQPGTYDITVDSEHTLMNVKMNVEVSAPSTEVPMGTLLEGDCDDSGGIDGSDFDIFGAAWDTCYGLPNWDPRADFDRSGCIDGSDFNLLGANWDKSSPFEIE